MSITIDQIDELKKRAKVSYSDAKEALEKSNGDILEALVYLESSNKYRSSTKSSFMSNILDKINTLIKKGSNIRCIMQKQDKIIFSLSLNIALLITFFLLPFIEFVVIGFVIALFTGHKIRFEKVNGEEMKINEALNKVYDTVDATKDKFTSNNVTVTNPENK